MNHPYEKNCVHKNWYTVFYLCHFYVTIPYQKMPSMSSMAFLIKNLTLYHIPKIPRKENPMKYTCDIFMRNLVAFHMKGLSGGFVCI